MLIARSFLLLGLNCLTLIAWSQLLYVGHLQVIRFIKKMSHMLWVEYKTDREAPISKVSTEGCNDVDDFIKKIKTESQLSIPKDS